jgi:hypothetical protein
MAMVVAASKRFTFENILSCYDLKLKMSLYFDRDSILNIACLNKWCREEAEAMFMTIWRVCPRITNVTLGSLTDHHVFQSWMLMTKLGFLLPCSDNMNTDLVMDRGGRQRTRGIVHHSVIWNDDKAFAFILRWLKIVYSGKARRDNEVFDDLAMLEMHYLAYMEVEIPEIVGMTEYTFRDRRGRNISRMTCNRFHDDEGEFLSTERLKNGRTWLSEVILYTDIMIQKLSRSHKIQGELSTGFTRLIRFVGGNEHMKVEVYSEFINLSVMHHTLEGEVYSCIANWFQ